MKTYLYRLCVVIAAAIGIVHGSGARNVFFRNLSEVGQLGDMTVSSIVRDSSGYVWLGTRQGVSRFDGIRLDNFKLPDMNGRASAVMALKPLNDDAGRVIAGKDDGLWLIDPVTRSTTHLDGEDLNGVQSLMSYSPDTIIAGCKDGVFLFSLASDSAMAVALPIRKGQSKQVVDMSRSDDVIWIATEHLIIPLSTTGLQPVGDNIEVGGSIHQLKSIDGRIFVGTGDKGLLVVDQETGLSRSINIGCNVVTAIEQRSDNKLYIGTDGAGIIVLDPATEQVTDRLTHSSTDPNSLHSNSIYSLHVDNSGIVWAGFYQLGADYSLYQTPLFEVFDEPYFNSMGINVRVVAIDGATIVLGTRDGLVIVDRDKGSMRNIKHPQLRSNLVISLLISDDKIYAGTYGGGLSIIDRATGSTSTMSTDQPFIDGHIFSIVKNRTSGDIWIGTSMGLYRYNRSGELTHYHYGNSHLPDGNVYGTFFDSTGRGWIMTATGLAIWDPYRETLRTDLFPADFFRHLDIRTIYETPDHTLYFSPDKGLPFYSDIAMKEYGEFGDGVLNGFDIKSIISDTEKSLWIATNYGMFKRDSTGQWSEYGFIDGIPGPIFNNAEPVVTDDGNIWMGNTKGLLSLNVRHASCAENQTLSLPVVTRVVIKGESHNLSHKKEGDDIIILPDGVRDFDLGVSTFSYTSPGSMAFDYMMKGVDTDWLESESDGVISYYDLKPGRYELLIRNAKRPQSINTVTVVVDGNGAMRSGMITIACVAAAVLTGVIVFMRHRRTVKKRKAEELERKQHEYIGEMSADGSEKIKYKSNRMSVAECEELSKRLHEVMTVKKPYTDPDLTLSNLAAMADTSAHKLSYYFSQYLHQTYYDYINTHRVNEFKRMASGEESSKFTLSGLSVKAGFSSRATFFRYFKKIEGITPAQYMKERGN